MFLIGRIVIKCLGLLCVITASSGFWARSLLVNIFSLAIGPMHIAVPDMRPKICDVASQKSTAVKGDIWHPGLWISSVKSARVR